MGALTPLQTLKFDTADAVSEHLRRVGARAQHKHDRPERRVYVSSSRHWILISRSGAGFRADYYRSCPC